MPAGVFPDFSLARQRTELIEPMEPRPADRECCMEHSALGKDLYEHVKDDFRTLAELRDTHD